MGVGWRIWVCPSSMPWSSGAGLGVRQEFYNEIAFSGVILGERDGNENNVWIRLIIAAKTFNGELTHFICGTSNLKMEIFGLRPHSRYVSLQRLGNTCCCMFLRILSFVDLFFTSSCKSIVAISVSCCMKYEIGFSDAWCLAAIASERHPLII